jgi:hypothetical protein
MSTNNNRAQLSDDTPVCRYLTLSAVIATRSFEKTTAQKIRPKRCVSRLNSSVHTTTYGDLEILTIMPLRISIRYFIRA